MKLAFVKNKYKNNL